LHVRIEFVDVARIDLRGGHPVIDFVNTVAWRGDPARRIDYLLHYSDLVAWCRHAGLVPAAEARDLLEEMRTDDRAAQRALTAAKRLREGLHALWTGDASSALATVTATYADALRRRELRVLDGRVAWVDRRISVRSPVDRLAVAAVDLITEIPCDRVKQCDDAACGWLFLDSSHRQNRRWCSAADCGNRDRARRHYERARG
jgi:predicted RNA-binding Zn ribbon-like protein